jgi:pimeloyl-ACP methyl ester carboxylesterase
MTATAGDAAAPTVAVTITDATCRVAPSSVTAGAIRLRLVNRAARAAEFAIGRRIVRARPSETRTATVDVAAGRAVYRCVVGSKIVRRGALVIRPAPQPPRQPPPWTGAQKFDVGGYSLFLRCSGERRPTVVIDNGRGQAAWRWDQVQPLVAQESHVCVYDRAGLGQSDPRPEGVYPGTPRLVDELRALLTRAAIAPPYVLVGWSFGGTNVQYFGHRYPAEVAGAVSVDAVPAWRCTPGLTHFVGEPADCSIVGGELRAAGAFFGAKPVAVLENALDTDEPWQQGQRELAQLSANKVHIRAERSDHFGFLTVQADLTAEAIRRVAIAARTNASLPQCTTVFPPLGATCLG